MVRAFSHDDMPVTYNKSEVKKIINSLNKLDPGLNKLGERLTSAIMGSIKERVQEKGLGLEGTMHYKSKAYKAFRKNKGYETSFKNLTITSNMLNSMISKQLSTGRFKIGFSFGELNKVSGTNAFEPWFGISNVEDKVIDDNIDEYLRKITL